MVRAGPPPLEEEPRRRAGHDRERARRRPARMSQRLGLAAAPMRVIPREQYFVGVERSLRIALQEPIERDLEVIEERVRVQV